MAEKMAAVVVATETRCRPNRT